NLKEGLFKLKEQKENAILSQNFEKAANFYHKEIEIEEKLQLKMVKNQLRQYKTCPKVTEESIAQVIESITGIDAKSLTKEKKEKLLLMEEEISKRVIGQEVAVKAITKAIIRGKTGISDPNRPIGSFLFLGPTGVGKTELSKALSKELFGKEDYLITFDMSEYMEKSSVAKLIGSPPGYVGYDDAPALTEKIKRRPYCVLLFDEIEKAHPDVHNLLLQVLEEGVLTDSRGTKISFKETVIIMTSNVGARFITENSVVGFNTGHDTKEKIVKENVLTELKRSFSPEFLNRIDDVIVFNKLKGEDINKITHKLMSSLEERLETMKINLSVSESAINIISSKGYDEKYGARPLRRYIQNNIEDALAEMIVKGDIAQNQTVILDTKDEEFSFIVK
ncbi:MAG: ATP-dependent Clp protease ATP-binding subunit, partial [Oscillospiraceae bacterium]